MNELLQRIHRHLESGRLAENLTPLFCQILNWGAPRGMATRPLQVGAPVNRTLTAHPVAQLSGLPVYRVDWPDDRLPTVPARRAVQRLLKPIHAEHLVCYVTRDQRQAAFIWARKRSDDKIELRTLPYEVGSPARTTIERLAELAFKLEELGLIGEPAITAVTDKLNKAFSVEAVTKQFYQEIANWYFWALDHARFPKDAPKQDGKDHVSLIRLITRVIFCWFLKEKGLIPSVLFDPQHLPKLLNGFAPEKPGDKQSVFYKAILQNLFFATLNTEMGKRAWARDEQNFMAHSLYRHRDLFRDPASALDLFKDIPFLNGGLFECLDRTEGSKDKPRYIRIDGFSRRPDSQPVVPDFLFFGGERTVDLSEAYGESRYRTARVRGLVETLSSYNFTLAENTPLDQEVALDPELLGKVFENLLAAYNPETRTTARKATGSYYTPRPIVDYMVDEALIAALAAKLRAALPQAPDVETRLRQLFALNEEPHQFGEAEVEALIRAIDHLKILDPACGSGAFPMGILHKLVYVLAKLDPENRRWRERQRQRAVAETAETFKSGDKEERERRLSEINEVFEENASDYGRKLYLIENCIYGVDIQPIAVQIAKLRFFISLIVDQRVNLKAENLGIRALPNLETKFVAANTLIGLDRPDQLALRNPKIDELERELARVREAHFTARTPATKRKYRERDAALRAEIAELLKHDGWGSATAKMLAAWDPYDQNASAPFFDAEWMFGVTNGFDVVIGNPPYLNVELVDAAQKAYYAEHYQTFYKRYDVFGLFYEAALTRHTSNGGAVAFIVPQQIANNLSYKKLRDLILGNRWLREVLYLGDKVFEAANNDVCVLFLTRTANESMRLVNALDFDRRRTTIVPANHFQRYGNVISFSGDAGAEGIFAKVFSSDRWLIKSRFSVFQGIVTGNNGAFLPTAEQIREAKIEKELLHPVLLGRDFEKWVIRSTSRRIIYVDGETNIAKFPYAERWLQRFRGELRKRRECVRGVIPWFSLQWPRVKSELDRVPKILVQRTRNPRLKTRIVATIDEVGVYGMESIIFIIPNAEDAPIYFLVAVLNSSLINYLYATKFLNVAIKAEYLKDTPIPNASRGDQQVLSDLARRILAAKRKDPEADVSAWERQIDQLVCRLYGLTGEEIKIVEQSSSEAGAGTSTVPDQEGISSPVATDE
ncbi:MAG TPA: N-6 DNA methylase [Candidatus Acidoferrales bacterium]|nr:N-6 DNA methylase [Candidatus Acidoferrales bacterium]